MKPPRVLVVLAEGAEEMETVIIVDVLRRGGMDLCLAGLDGSQPVRCSREVVLVPDQALADAAGPFDALVLPGGAEGTRRLAASASLGQRLREQETQGQTIAAICAAPMALVTHGVGRGRAMTSHASVRSIVASHARFLEEPVVEDGPFVTSQGPGTTFPFAFALIRRFLGEAKVQEVRQPMMFPSQGG